ncbi:hypothetical protein RINTHM_2810 [Richelia intracellularis HM01]|nr:hypothetical protein RINTHM_2810 [Richelia intracellularis HM01]
MWGFLTGKKEEIKGFAWFYFLIKYKYNHLSHYPNSGNIIL